MSLLMPISARSVFNAEIDQNDYEKKYVCKMTQFLILDLTNGPSLFHLIPAVPSGVTTLGGHNSLPRAAAVPCLRHHFEKYSLA